MNILSFLQKGIKLEFVSDDSEDFLCNRYRIVSVSDQTDLLATYRRLSKEFPDHSFLITLDDLGQACYSSMHACLTHDLDETEGYDLSSLSASCFEEGEHKGCLTHLSEFFIRQSNFMKGCESVTLDDVRERKIGLFEESIDEFTRANKNILSVMDSDAYLLKVPVVHSYETIFAFPNGYFSSDLSPFENYVFAKNMQTEFGLDLIGMGASHIAFLKTHDFSEPQLEKLIEFLSGIYRNEFEAAVINAIKNVVREQELLVLRYTE